MKALTKIGIYLIEVLCNFVMLEVCSIIPRMAFKVFPYEKVCGDTIVMAIVLGLIAGTYVWQLTRFTPVNALLIALEFYIGFRIVLPLLLYYVIYRGNKGLAIGVSNVLMLLAILIWCVAIAIYKVVKRIRNRNNED